MNNLQKLQKIGVTHLVIHIGGAQLEFPYLILAWPSDLDQVVQILIYSHAIPGDVLRSLLVMKYLVEDDRATEVEQNSEVRASSLVESRMLS